MDIKYFHLATLFATGLFVAFVTTTSWRHREDYWVFYLVSLVVIWISYLILRKKWLIG